MNEVLWKLAMQFRERTMTFVVNAARAHVLMLRPVLITGDA